MIYHYVYRIGCFQEGRGHLNVNYTGTQSFNDILLCIQDGMLSGRKGTLDYKLYWYPKLNNNVMLFVESKLLRTLIGLFNTISV